ncbi:epoxide hydrolase family protein [Luteimicrobium subarcticum]|uniref:Pimeloyl-ACP methyl ester carboxylesterase n=1 Tax=Luteimicrobium subarcticum TaxID=620910 RepID=A0A2M8WW73_9MICO|nr:epoxide hydrolase family protein [Luteimicrobium subarcticum]PJI95174.1 pimeloyl-ACP methyl ester carboxylesterase [Luteimicrobium subarcticum]
MTTNQSTPSTVRPFRVEVPQAELDDLADRLARTRLPRPAPGDDWTYGTPNAYLRDMVERWRTSYDWRETEARLNALDQFVTDVDGQEIHFLHVRSAEAGATPLLLAHSYPGSVLDFVDVIGPLVDPVAHGGRAEDAFDVVVPSMPGTGFSSGLAEGGWTMARVARAYDVLMRRLGYDAYGVHGSDGGAMIARELGLLEPEGFLGLHVLQLFSFPSGDPAEMADFGPKEYAALGHMQWFQSVGGYNAINSSRPQTVAVGLADSPVGQLAWSELFESFGNGTSLVTPDQVLAQVTLEWLTNTAAAFGRYHYEEAHAGAEPQVNHARTGVSVFADDFQTIRSLAARDNDRIEQFVEHPDGGHYAALERPAEIVADLREFFA